MLNSPRSVGRLFGGLKHGCNHEAAVALCQRSSLQASLSMHLRVSSGRRKRENSDINLIFSSTERPLDKRQDD
jgi:hypothetical protein